MFDTHCHLCDPKFDIDRKEVIDRAYKSGVKYILNLCGNLSELNVHNATFQSNDRVYLSVGVHPHEAQDINQIKLLFNSVQTKFIAVGEIGLDYYYTVTTKEIQQQIFCYQIRYAKERSLPIIIHSRDAMDDTINILKEEQYFMGIMHCFTGTETQAQILTDLGLYISISGIVTFPQAIQIRKVASTVPLDKLLVETDAPYLTPVPYRGKRNEPEYLRFTVEEIAQLRNVPLQKMVNITTENAYRVLWI